MSNLTGTGRVKVVYDNGYQFLDIQTLNALGQETGRNRYSPTHYSRKQLDYVASPNFLGLAIQAGDNINESKAWLADVDEAAIYELNPLTLEETTTSVDVSSHTSSIAGVEVASGDLYVVNTSSTTAADRFIVRIDPADGSLVGKHVLNSSQTGAKGIAFIHTVARFAVLDADGSIYFYTPAGFYASTETPTETLTSGTDLAWDALREELLVSISGSSNVHRYSVGQDNALTHVGQWTFQGSNINGIAYSPYNADILVADQATTRYLYSFHKLSN